MSVSVSQISIGRSLDRSIDQSRFPGQSLDQSICVCRCLYKEQHPPTRSHFCREILRLVDLFSIFSSHLLNLFCARTAYPRSRDIIHTSRSHRAVARPPDRSCACKTLDEISDTQKNWANESCGQESAHEMWRSAMKKAEKVEQKRGRCTDDRPGFLERS